MELCCYRERDIFLGGTVYVYCWPACEMRASGRELISPHPLNYDDLINAVGSFFLSFFWYTATQTTTRFFLFLVVKKRGR
jgi:hypothetical protein